MRHARIGTVFASLALLGACTSDSGQASDDIVGGTLANAGEFPGMARLAWDGACGATLVAPRWALTAAHCIPGSGAGINGTVTVGRLDLTSNDGEVLQIEAAYTHPAYTSAPSANDIALVKLARPARSPRARIALLKDVPSPDVGTSVIASGWGATKAGGVSSARLLKFTDRVVDIRACDSKLATVALGAGDSDICVGGGNKDTCQGDSGGPLWIQKDGKLLQFGITSRGYGCATPGFPGVYTRVSAYFDWLAFASGGEIIATPAPTSLPDSVMYYQRGRTSTVRNVYVKPGTYTVNLELDSKTARQSPPSLAVRVGGDPRFGPGLSTCEIPQAAGSASAVCTIVVRETAWVHTRVESPSDTTITLRWRRS